MTSFPGEHDPVPKRLLEALPNQPLLYLVPKAKLASLISSEYSLKIEISDDQSLLANNITKSMDQLDIPPPESIRNTYYTKDAADELNKIIYKRPIYIAKQSRNMISKDENNNNLFSNLSPLAKKCLEEISPNIKQGYHIDEAHVVETLQRKRKMEDILDTDIDLTHKFKHDKIVMSSGVSVSETTIAKQYLDNLIQLLEHIRSEMDGKSFTNLERWININNSNICLNERTLQHIELLLKNISSVPEVNNKLSLNDLILILDLMIQNITICTTTVLSNKKKERITKIIATLSINIIFSIFLLKRSEREIYMEKYAIIPIKYLSNFVTEIKEKSALKDLHNELVLFTNSIQHLPCYIRQNIYLDDGLLTKLTYVFTDIIVDSTVTFNVSASDQYCWNNIKNLSCEILVAIFQLVPTQRLFLINEFLSNIDKLPSKRVHKKIKTVAKDRHVTYFTECLMRMLQCINALENLNTVNGETKDIIDKFKKKNIEQEKQLSNFIGHINESIFKKFLQNSTKYRYIMETYILDLIALFRLPNYYIASQVLSSMLGKLLDVFDSASTSPVVEITCLLILGQIGSALFDIKLNTLPQQDNNVVKLLNYPEYIPQFLESFQRCLVYIANNNSQESSYKYFQGKLLEKLIRLHELNTDSNNISNIDNYIDRIIRQVPFNDIVSKNVLSLEDINNDYCSVLQSDELISQYDTYFHILLTMLDSSKIKLKSTAVKSLSLLVSQDSSILSNPMVKAAITQVLVDNSAASVRDAILDLLNAGSCYVEYYKQININFDDDSILVRKHILKINEQIYTECDDLEIATYVAIRILLRLEDEEDSIVENAKNVLLKQWLLSFHNSDKLDTNEGKIIEQSIAVIAGVVSADTKNTEVFEDFLNFYLLKKEVHPPQQYNQIIKNLHTMVNVLVQEIVNLQAQNSSDDKQKANLQCHFKLLALFADAIEIFITKEHIFDLYPYMLSEEKNGLHYDILHVFNKTLQKSLILKNSFLENIETDLLKQLVRLNTKEIDEAVSIIWQAASQRNNKTRIIQACSSCLIHLNPYIIAAAKSKEKYQVDNKIQRLLYLITSFARFCLFDSTVDRLPFVDKKEGLPEYVAKCLLIFSRNSMPHDLRRTSIKNLIRLSGTYPKLFNSRHILNMLKSEFKSNRLDIKLVIIEALLEFFSIEEARSLRQIGLVGRMYSNRRTKEQNAHMSSPKNDEVCFALSNKFINDILDMCLFPITDESVTAIRLLKLIVKCGYINPSKCIPHSIALLASNQKIITHTAIGIVTELLEQHETMVLNNISKGIVLAIDYSKTLFNGVYYRHNMFLNTLQNIFLVDKKGMNKFHKYLDKFINFQLSDAMSIDSNFVKMSSILFLSTNIAKLKFCYQTHFFSIIKMLDFTEEQMRDNILEVLKNNREEDWDIVTLKLSIIIQYVLKDLKNYLLDKYGYKLSILDSLFENNPRDDGKPMPAEKEDCGNFVETVDNIVRLCDDDCVCINYLSEQRYVD